jgi:predicted RND superfamily exporter protein
VEDACAMTLKTAGPAMLITTAVISSGAVVFLLSTLNSLRYFGAAVAGVSILSLLCDLIFVPALVTLVLKDKKE